MFYYTSGSGRIEFQLTAQDANTGHHTGRCDDDIDYLLTLDHIKKQLDAINPALLAEELREYGAWSADELADHEQNKARILWIACGDIADRQLELDQYFTE